MRLCHPSANANAQYLPRKPARDAPPQLVDGVPHLWASDTTGRQGASWVWSTGNTGTEGRFFAQVGPKPGCKADVSPTIRVRRNP